MNDICTKISVMHENVFVTIAHFESQNKILLAISNSGEFDPKANNLNLNKEDIDRLILMLQRAKELVK